MHKSLVAASFLVLATTGLSAQDVTPYTELQPGVKLRVQAPGVVAGRYEGTLLVRTADTLTIGSPNGAPVKLPVARITTLEVSRGKSRTAGALRGIMWGAPIGLGFGLASVGAIDDCVNCASEYSRGGWLALNTFGGALWGAGIGAIVGRERWNAFQLAPRTSIGVSPSGVMLGMRLSLP